ncbi:MAG: very short patch repair endonuclease [Anaerolineae bacterium]|nr:very short patch repair endonuclease [Anaerolineae bacterium]
MADNLKPADRQKAMRAVKGKGTTPERRLFAMLAGMRLKGWRKNAADITGKPDVVFSHEHIAIFVDGCFWHGCPHCQRKLKPDSNRHYWERKINRNIELAKSHNQKLLENGWTVIRIWEHELKKPADRLQIRDRIRQAIKAGTDK